VSADIHDRLEAIFRQVFDDDLVLHDELTASMVDGWDSLTHISLVYAIEEEFDIEFTQQEMSGMANVGGLKAIVARKSSVGST
jgi:acyl carrier protein